MDYSLSDIRSVTDANQDGFAGGSGAWLIIILFLFLFGAGGWGGNGNNARNAYDTAATQGQMTDQFNFEAIRQGQADIVSALKDQTSNVIGTVKDVNYNNLSNIRDVEAMVASNGAQMSQCCCSIERGIDGINYNGALNTNQITTAIHAEGEQTRALINQNTIQDLRDRVSDLQLAQSQCAQNAYLTNTLRPYPVPAYMTCNPYGCGMYGCGSLYGNGCGC